MKKINNILGILLIGVSFYFGVSENPFLLDLSINASVGMAFGLFLYALYLLILAKPND